MGKMKKGESLLTKEEPHRESTPPDRIIHGPEVTFDQYPGAYLSNDTIEPFFSIEKFKEKLNIIVYPEQGNDLEFDLIGVDASVANALRRILIAEVPTVAIEKVYIINNTSIIQDEILAQRLGLIPIMVDPRRLSFRAENEEPNDLNTIVFQLKVKCERGSTTELINENVLSSALKWIPQGAQETEFVDSPIRPVFPDILIAKLRPGQELDLELHCEKNIGKEHAKWSPVATATYRLLPTIKLLAPIEGDLAEKFISCFPPGVVSLVTSKKTKKAVISNPRLDTVSREVLRHPEFIDKVELGRQKDYFICMHIHKILFIVNVESTGILPPSILVIEALDILIAKCDRLLSALTDIGY